jgi:hypothetical protein
MVFARKSSFMLVISEFSLAHIYTSVYLLKKRCDIDLSLLDLVPLWVPNIGSIMAHMLRRM